MISTLSTFAPAPALAADCRFVLGFKALHDAIPNTVGECKVNEHYNPQNGDALQETTRGLLVWRKADNFTAFTDGYRTWVNGPYGIQQRLNTERFPWEKDAVAPASTQAIPQQVVESDAVVAAGCNIVATDVTNAFLPYYRSGTNLQQVQEYYASRCQQVVGDRGISAVACFLTAYQSAAARMPYMVNPTQEKLDQQADGYYQSCLLTGATVQPSAPQSPAVAICGGRGHWVSEIIDSGRLVMLEDRTLWQIAPLDRINTMLWLPVDNITLVGSDDLMYPCKLVNTSQRNTANAKLVSN